LQREGQAGDVTQAAGRFRQAVVVVGLLADLQGAATVEAVQGRHGGILGSRATGSALDPSWVPGFPARPCAAGRRARFAPQYAPVSGVSRCPCNPTPFSTPAASTAPSR